MDPRKLRHFVAVAEAGHFTHAAEAERISQSGLSASIRALEREAGLPLFERTTRRVLLTPAGRALLPHARRILREAAEADAALAALRGADAGALALGVVQTLTAVDLPAAIARLHARRPRVEVTLREAPTLDLLADVGSGALDLAFVALDAAPLPPGLTMLAEYPETLTLVAGEGHPLAARGSVALRDLAGERFIDFQAGLGLQTFVDALFARAGVRRQVLFRTSQMDQVLALVRHGLGVAVVPEPIARRSGLARVRLRPGPPSRRLALVGRSPAPPANPAARAFLALLDEPRPRALPGASARHGGPPQAPEA